MLKLLELNSYGFGEHLIAMGLWGMKFVMQLQGGAIAFIIFLRTEITFCEVRYVYLLLRLSLDLHLSRLHRSCYPRSL